MEGIPIAATQIGDSERTISRDGGMKHISQSLLNKPVLEIESASRFMSVLTRSQSVKVRTLSNCESREISRTDGDCIPAWQT